MRHGLRLAAGLTYGVVDIVQPQPRAVPGLVARPCQHAHPERRGCRFSGSLCEQERAGVVTGLLVVLRVGAVAVGHLLRLPAAAHGDDGLSGGVEHLLNLRERARPHESTVLREFTGLQLSTTPYSSPKATIEHDLALTLHGRAAASSASRT